VSAGGFLIAIEALLIGKKFGLDPAVMVDILNASTGVNNSTQVKFKQFVLSGAYNAGFSLDLVTELDPQHGYAYQVGGNTLGSVGRIDESNAMLQARHAGWSWEAVDREAEASVEALLDAIGHSSNDVLCECDEWSVAGIGANGVNHAMGHLPDIADLAGGLERFDAYAREVETVLRRGHLPPRDSGVILYNIACQRALSGQLDEARRLLRDAFARRHDLLESAREDPDLVALADDLPSLATARPADPA